MDIAIIGSRTFCNHRSLNFDEAFETNQLEYKYFCNKLKSFNITHIISGGAQGADACAERYAKEKHLPITIYYASWEEYGKSAGYKRNIKIVDNSDIVVAFWDGISKGTKHSIDYATKQNKELHIFTDWI